jgi:hypothetical protein
MSGSRAADLGAIRLLTQCVMPTTPASRVGTILADHASKICLVACRSRSRVVCNRLHFSQDGVGLRIITIERAFTADVLQPS